ncbi:MAG: FAD-dependent oxidoreductase, partial [Gammaproteobacteria bacterium]
LLPALADVPIEHHWSGLRPGIQKQVPVISEHPSIRGLFVNTGHFRNGVVTAPASCKLCTDLLLNKPTILDHTAFSL